MTRDEAKRSLIEQMVDEARHDAAKHIRQIESEAREEADRRAKKIVSIAIERLAGEFVAERTVSVVHLPSDDMKGRIIGREGRNIRAIEAATGVDLIIDDTPEAVVISCHNPIRREIARLALERLISDGRIHPGRIEEVVRKAEQELDESDPRGRAAGRPRGRASTASIPELVKLLGMLKYRYSYAQNVLMHSIEAAFIAGAMAAELGLNEKQARRAALLHDIGKALTHEVEGSHAIVGGEIARKYGESAKIVNAIAAHHEEVKAETILAPLVDAADALSGARPGRAARGAGELRQAARGPRAHQQLLPGRREVVRRPGRARDPHHRRAGHDARRPGRDAGARRGATDRAGDDVSRADQGDGDPRDAGERDRALSGCGCSSSVTSSGGPGRRARRGDSSPRLRRDASRSTSSSPTARTRRAARGSTREAPRSCATPASTCSRRAITSGSSGRSCRTCRRTQRLLRPLELRARVSRASGWTVRPARRSGLPVGVINLIGRVFMGAGGLSVSGRRGGPAGACVARRR